MTGAVHVIDADGGASALLASAVAACVAGDECSVIALGPSAGRAMLARGGVRVDAWASAPCGLMRLAARPLRRAALAACGGQEPRTATCWSADPVRADALAACMRRAARHAEVRVGGTDAMADALRRACHTAASPVRGASASAVARHDARAALGAGEGSLVVIGAADAPLRANALRMLDVAGRAMLAGADAHLVLPECMPHLARTRRYARGLGLEARLHMVEGAEWPVPWWHAADVILVSGAAPLVGAAAGALGLQVVSAPGHESDESSPERRAASARTRDAAAAALVGSARARAQSVRNASAAST